MADQREPAPYDEDGGFIPPGLTWARNDTGRPERIFTERELHERPDGESS